MRVTIRVRPGSARPGVGSEYDGALVVRVTGAASRTRVVEVAGADPAVLDRLLALGP